MDRLGTIQAALAVSELGSFVRAAEQLGLSAANVTRQVQALERHLGCVLFTRTTRTVTLTPKGAAFLAAASNALDALQDAEATLRDRAPVLTGLVRVTASPLLSSTVLPTAVAALLERHPQLRVVVEGKTGFADPEQTGADAALTVGLPTAAKERCQKIATCGLVLCASPRYLQICDRPRTPDELAQHRILHCGTHASTPTWALRGGIGQTSVDVDPSLIAADPRIVITAARAGAGVALVPRFCVAQEIADGTLLPILEGFEPKPVEVGIVYPHKSLMRTKVASLVDELLRQLR